MTAGVSQHLCNMPLSILAPCSVPSPTTAQGPDLNYASCVCVCVCVYINVCVKMTLFGDTQPFLGTFTAKTLAANVYTG